MGNLNETFLSPASIAIYVLIGVGFIILTAVLIRNYGIKKIQTSRQITSFINWISFKYYERQIKRVFKKECEILVEVILLEESLKTEFLEYCMIVATKTHLYLVAFPLEGGVKSVKYSGAKFECNYKKHTKLLGDNTKQFIMKQGVFTNYLKSYNLSRQQITLIVPCESKKFYQQQFTTPWEIYFISTHKVVDFIIEHHNNLQKNGSDESKIDYVGITSYLKKNNCAKKRQIPFFRSWSA